LLEGLNKGVAKLAIGKGSSALAEEAFEADEAVRRGAVDRRNISQDPRLDF
jgi:hypothetical protein